ncbi:hypothetical protein T484DRAFT_1802527, partial [Baffinella frigidus]
MKYIRTWEGFGNETRTVTLALGTYNRRVCEPAPSAAPPSSPPALTLQLFQAAPHLCDRGYACGGGATPVCSPPATERYAIKGAASATHLPGAGGGHMLVANYWDGASGYVESALVRVGTWEVLQTVLVRGARKWLHVAAAFGGPTLAFLLSSTTPDPVIDTAAPGVLATAWASSAAAFEGDDGATYMTLAVFSDGASASNGADSVIYRLGMSINTTHATFTPGGGLIPHASSGEGGGVVAVEVQRLRTQAAYDVTHVIIGASRYLAFTSNAATAPSLLFTSPLAGTPHFTLHQTLPTVGAMGVHAFVSGTTYLLIAQTEKVLMLRWNGTLFLGVNDANTNPGDSAGGQELPVHTAQA